MRLDEQGLRKIIRQEVKNVVNENGGTPEFDPKPLGEFQASSGSRYVVLRDKLGRGPHVVILDERKQEVFEMTPSDAMELRDILGEVERYAGYAE